MRRAGVRGLFGTIKKRLRQQRRRTGHGSVLVEFSLVGTLFLMLLIGIADFGQFLFVQESIVERARAAARWGAITDPTNVTAIRNMVLYLQSTAPTNRTPALGLTASMVSVSTPDAGTDNYRLTVKISGYTYQTLSPYLAGRYAGAPVTVSVALGQYN